MKQDSGFVRKVVPPLVAWGVAKLLEAPKMQASVRSLDRRVHQRQELATRAVRQAGRNAISNAISNGVWLAAGIVAFAAGIAFLVRAVRPK